MRSTRVFRSELKGAAPAAPTDVGEAQEVERLRLAEPAAVAVRRCLTAELDQSRLLRMQGQAKPPHPFPQLRQKPLGLGPMLKAGDDVVGVAHQDDCPAGLAFAPVVCPQVEDVMQVDVGQHRRNHRTLRCAHRPWPHHSVFHHPGPQPFADQAEDPPVSDPVFDEFDQPVVVHRVEEPRDVGVEDEVDASLGDPHRQRVQRVVLAASRPEAVAEPQKVCFPDRVQHLDHRALDDLVLQRGNAERPLPSVRLGDIHPPRRQRPIGAAVNAVLEILEPRLEICAVFPSPHPVHSSRRLPLQRLVGIPQQVDIDVMEERRELLLLSLLGRLPYTVQPG